LFTYNKSGKMKVRIDYMGERDEIKNKYQTGSETGE
jgi:hypothetical protein